ncbi:MAG: alpha/beta hydrolase [Fretibacterium sp.]|uniref:alpha/beta hydrolase n=1 Tax=Fretibacterium sp. OH1220_COT-178 TaxID=2491047 RepID=UPI000F5E216F|nr:alpha/beta hydrolase [Fretibacterium sp. OH1220_COT-178]MDO4785865.1 alpha/beta hydrolase [Fretibacterium sp.]RRD63779.1 alpha/beta hydrolase [Fretibacterium sp. OH1220_COT-178]
MFQEEIVRSFDGVELYRCADVPSSPRGTVILLHGLGGHSRRFDEPARHLSEAGWCVVRYDHRGHGRSGGARAYVSDYAILVKDAEFVVEAAGRDSPGPVFTCGYSMGGLISLLLGIRRPELLRGQIFLGACACELPLYRNFRRPHIDRIALRTSPSVGSALLSRDPGVADEYDRDPWVLHAFTNRLLHEVFIRGVDSLEDTLPLHRLPCLVLHGGDDRLVPVESSRILHDRSSSADKTIEILPNCYHDILHDAARDAVVSRIASWMAERL